MRCPTCGIECRVKATEEESNTVIRFFCRNRQCPDNGKEVGQKIIAKAP